MDNMLTAKELRIGNFLRNFLGEIFPANIETLREIESRQSEFPLPTEVELTEDLLPRLGFVPFEFCDEDWVIDLGRKAIRVARAQDDDLCVLYRGDVGERWAFLDLID